MPPVTSIAELLATEPGKVIPQVHGTIAIVAERYPPTGWMEETNSDGSKRQWSLQTIILEQAGAQIEVQIANKEPIPFSAKGRSLYLIAHQKARGGMSGIKVDLDEGRKVLRVSASGELVFAEPASNVAAPQAQPASAVSGSGAAALISPVQPVAARIGAETERAGGESRPSASPATVPADAKAWAEIARNIDQFGNLYELCQARAGRMNVSGEVMVLTVAHKLFEASLEYMRGNLPGELPTGKLPAGLIEPVSPK